MNIWLKRAEKPLRRASLPIYLISGVTGVHLLLAVVSFLKDVAFASAFGTSPPADVLNLAFLLPETISYNLIAFVLATAAVPTLSRLWAEGRQELFTRCLFKLAAQWAAIMIAVGLLLLFFQAPICTMLGYPPELAAAFGLQRVYNLLLLTMPVFPLFAIGTAGLMATGAFFTAAAGPIVMNGFMLVGAIAVILEWTQGSSGIFTFASSIAVGSCAMTGWMWLILIHRIRRALPMQAGRGSIDLKQVYIDFVPLLLVTLSVQAVYAAERMLASRLGSGTLAGLQYAFRVSQFPNWVFVAAVTSVLLPAMSRSAAERKNAVPTSPDLLLSRVLRLTIGLLVPAACILYFGREWVVSLLFSRGTFNAESEAITSVILAGYSLAMVGQAVSTVCTRTLLAEGRLKPAVWIYGASAIGSVGLNVWLVPRYGASAIGYIAFAGWTLNALFMYALAAGYFTGRRVC